MATTKYSYSISLGTANGKVAPGALTAEINGSEIVHGVHHLDVYQDTLDIWMKDAISSGDQTKLTQVVNNHQGEPLGEKPTTVIVKEEVENATGGHYQSASFDLVVDQSIGAWKELSITYPYPISLFSAEWLHSENMEGDELEISIAPETTIGALTQDAAIGDTRSHVQPSVIQNVYIGTQIHLDDGTLDSVGRCIDVDPIGNTIDIETPLLRAFLSSTPTYVKQTVQLVPHLRLRGSLGYALGKDIIGGSYIPANAPIVARYRNNEGSVVNKVWSVVMEYKY